MFFFLEHAGELRIIILRRKNWVEKTLQNTYTNTLILTVADISLGPLWPRPQALAHFLYTVAHCSKEAQLIYQNEPMEWP